MGLLSLFDTALYPDALGWANSTVAMEATA
jgi:hypothetical protein